MMTAVFLLAGFLLPGTALAQGTRSDIAFIHLDNVFTNYNKTKLAEAQLKEDADEVKQNRGALIENLKTLRDDHKALQAQTKSAALNDKARAKKRSEAEEKLIEIKALENRIGKLEDAARRKFDEQSRRARKRLVDEINAVVEQYAKEKELTAVIDISGESLNGVPTVVYHREDLDITDSIIKLINK